LRINKTAHAFEEMHRAATLVASAGKEDVVVGISFSGETGDVGNILHLAREGDVQTVSVTTYGKTAVTDQAHLNLYASATAAPTFRSGATFSRMAQLLVIDILFMCVASEQYDETVGHLAATRAAVDFIKTEVRKNSVNKKED